MLIVPAVAASAARTSRARRRRAGGRGGVGGLRNKKKLRGCVRVRHDEAYCDGKRTTDDAR